MKKKTQKIQAVILAIVMLAVVTVAVSAAGGLNSSNKKAKDGLEILDGTYYDNSDFYNKNASLGIANTFHLFAFNQLDVNVHCNGNFAAKVANVGTNNGTNQFTDKNELCIVTDKLVMNSSTRVNTWYVPVDAKVTDRGGNKLSNPINAGQISIDTGDDCIANIDLNGIKPAYVAHINEDYLDLAAEQAQYADLSNKLSKVADNYASWTCNGLGKLVLNDEGIY